MTGSSQLLTRTNAILVALAVVIQSAMLWGITTVKDFEGGDTMGYVLRAREYADILYSPMYTGAMRIVLDFTGDAYATNVATRVFALLVIAALVMLLFRRFVSPALSLILFVIFAFNPGYVDAMYTVHIWGMILPLIALVAVAYMPPEKSIPWAVGLFVINAMVMRNEYVLVPLIFLALVMYPGRFLTWRDVREKWRAFVIKTWFIWVFVIAVAVVLIVVSWLPVWSEPFRLNLESKHTMNVCQVYAYYRMEIGDDRVIDPWTKCQLIMQADFGTRQPSLTTAFLANPRAILEMGLYNVSLLPNGLQVLLTGGFFGGDSPDYWAQRTNVVAPVTTAALLLVAGRGAWSVREFGGRAPRGEQPDRSAERAFVLLTISIMALMLFLALSQRPRPSYIFLTTVIILLFVGIGMSRMRIRVVKWMSLALVVALATTAIVTQVRHPLFGDDYVNLFYGKGQPVLTEYRSLAPLAADFPAEPVKITISAPVDPESLCFYLRRAGDTCTAVIAPELTLTWSPQ